MSAALDEADQVEAAAVGVVSEADILYHLRAAVTLAEQMGRHDWSRKMETLIRQISGRRHSSSSPVSLRPVGPVVLLGDWVNNVQVALEEFVADVKRAHADDPEGFPLERTSADWFQEFATRIS